MTTITKYVVGQWTDQLCHIAPIVLSEKPWDVPLHPPPPPHPQNTNLLPCKSVQNREVINATQTMLIADVPASRVTVSEDRSFFIFPSVVSVSPTVHSTLLSPSEVELKLPLAPSEVEE